MIDKNKTYKTRDGREVRIYATDGNGYYPIHGAVFDKKDNCWIGVCWSAKGLRCLGTKQPIDLIEVVPLIECWAVVRKPENIVAATRFALGEAKSFIALMNPDRRDAYSIVHLREVIE